MARSINKVILLGNITKEPELRYTTSGTAVATFSIATNHSYKSGDEWKEQAEFHRITVWAKLAEFCSQYLSKGSKVYAEGRMQTRKFTDKNGVDKYVTEVVADTIIPCDKKSDKPTDQDEPASDQAHAGNENVDDSEIPF